MHSLLAAISHSPTPSTPLRILLLTHRTTHLPKISPRPHLLLPLLHLLRLHLQQARSNFLLTPGTATYWSDLNDDRWLEEMEVRHGALQCVFRFLAAAETGGCDGGHAFIVVLVGDD